MRRNLWEKLRETMGSLLPILVIVLLLNGTVAPLPSAECGLFCIGAGLLLVGMALFSLGADMAMVPMGEIVGERLTRTRRPGLICAVCLVIGVIVTVAEPDLAVLADQVPGVANALLIWTVALGVGIFLVIALLRMLFQVRLSYLLMGFYGLVFLLACFAPRDFLAVAFDSGGVTTGPVTVPFIMALGIGLASVRGDDASEQDSFGLVALASIGPILAVLVLGLASGGGGSFAPYVIPEARGLRALLALFVQALPRYAREVALALLPVTGFFLVFQALVIRMHRRPLLRILMGILYAYIGLVLFLTGVNVGFMPVGYRLGAILAGKPYAWALIPLGMVIGYFIVAAEPAVHVLKEQVEEITGGTISKSALGVSLSLGVAAALGLAMARVLWGFPLVWVLVPGYLLAMGLTFFVPEIFTAIAFDSGGVASGPMTATFLLPFASGACRALGGNVLTDAFGIVALVAMAPLITIQILGLIYRRKMRRAHRQQAAVGREIIDFSGEDTDE